MQSGKSIPNLSLPLSRRHHLHIFQLSINESWFFMDDIWFKWFVINDIKISMIFTSTDCCLFIDSLSLGRGGSSLDWLLLQNCTLHANTNTILYANTNTILFANTNTILFADTNTELFADTNTILFANTKTKLYAN